MIYLLKKLVKQAGKLFLILPFLVILICDTDAQILKKLGEKVKSEVAKTVKNADNNQPPPSVKNTDTEQMSMAAQPSQNKAAYISKFDFIPGEEVIYYYDFSDVNIGDAPENWQIDGSAEVVEVEGYPGKYIMLNDHSAIIPEAFEELPDEFTVQFDLICTNPFAWGSNNLYFAFANTNPNQTPDGTHEDLGSVNNTVFWIGIHPGSQAAAANKGHGEYILRTRSGVKKGIFSAESFNDKEEGRFAKISIWRQKKRVRVYVNENKVLDLTSILPPDMIVNTLAWSAYRYFNDDKYFIGNIRIAKSLPDSRNDMLQTGKYSTTGILFDVNSAEIKPESYGILKEIAGHLKLAEGAKITIIGHTDSDGDETKNLELSKKRAEAVKKSLVNDFGISSSLIETEGKGESEPVAPNDTPQNKAKNRRVEFVIKK
ncbi:MAG: OmpA family protein [Thermoflavifilum aggregans]|nr:OmpA family protein [Thermoflavifilum aggregans]